MKLLTHFFIFLLFASCAQLYQVNITDIDNTGELIPFEIKVSELGVSLQDASKISNYLLKNSSSNAYVQNAISAYQLFLFGPTTGNKVFNDTYADPLFIKILEQCPTGKITGLTSVREMRKYPIISGEIIKIKGYCLKNKKTNENHIVNNGELI